MHQVSAGIAERLTLAIDETCRSSALLELPPAATACFVLAHGAGAGMEHPSMTAVAAELATRNIATLRFQFPSMERSTRRPLRRSGHATGVQPLRRSARLAPTLALIAGGRSFGRTHDLAGAGHRTSPGVKGLAFIGFPLHPAGRPSDERAEHLREVKIPMLFLQGTRDELAQLGLLQPLIDRLGARHSEAAAGCGPFVLCARTHRTQGRGSQGRDAGRARDVDRAGNSHVMNSRSLVTASTLRSAKCVACRPANVATPRAADLLSRGIGTD